MMMLIGLLQSMSVNGFNRIYHLFKYKSFCKSHQHIIVIRKQMTYLPISSPVSLSTFIIIIAIFIFIIDTDFINRPVQQHIVGLWSQRDISILVLWTSLSMVLYQQLSRLPLHPRLPLLKSRSLCIAQCICRLVLC